MTDTRFTTMQSPVGELMLTGDGTGLTGLYMGADARPLDAARGECDDGTFENAVEQLTEYFEGTRRTFDLPLSPAGTPFQLKVWEALRTIPYGTTISYGEQARRVDNPKASRAVGLANGRNPIGIIVPCHRVIGANGSLTGYGGGLDNKRLLLELEAKVIAAGP